MMKQRGFTLIEVMMAMAIFAASVAAFAGFCVTMARLNESSRDLTQAMNDGRLVLEAIRDTAQSEGLTGVTPGTGVIGRYPAGVNLLAPGQPFSGLGTLTGETITAAYGAGDPLPVTLQIDWDESGHDRDPIAVTTLITKR